MADWNYIAGEDNINQDFLVVDSGGQVTLPDVDSADMTILNSDLSAVTPPIQNLSVAILSNDPLTLRYIIDLGANNMPQTPAMYLAIIRLNDSTNSRIIKTFELDLRVFIGG